MKNKKVKENINLDYEREFGKRYSTVPVNVFDKLKIYSMKKRYSNYIAGIKSDKWNQGDKIKGIKNKPYETQLLIESIILMVEGIVDKYEVFSSDKKMQKVKVTYSKYNNRFDRHEFDIQLNRKRTKQDIDNLSEIIDEEINSSDKYNFELIVKADIKKMYMVPKNKNVMYISSTELNDIVLNENIFMGIGADDKNILEGWFNDDNVHTFIFGATGSGKTTFIKNIIKQIEYKKTFDDLVDEKQVFNKHKIKKKDIWKTKLEYEIWDIVKGKDFKKVDIKNSKGLIDRIKGIAAYISQVNKNEIVPESKKIIIWDEFISSISKLKLHINDDEKFEVIKLLINSILRESRSAGVHFVFSSQRILESGELEGIQIMSNINVTICLRVAGNTSRYIKQNLKLFVEKDITKLKKGEMWFVDKNGNEKYCNWLLYDESKLDSIELTEYQSKVEIESENNNIDYFENISKDFFSTDKEE